MDLSKLKPAEGAVKKSKRIGRGNGSGKGTTAGRGMKGQKSRSGGNIPAHFEGGQMPLIRRIPKFGFHNPNSVTYQPLNVGRLSQAVADGILDADAPITPEVLVEVGIINKNQLVKILGDGTIEEAVEVSAHAASASAQKKIEAAGGSVEVLGE